MGPKTARFFLLHSNQDCECIMMWISTFYLWMRDKAMSDVHEAVLPNQEARYREMKRSVWLCLMNSCQKQECMVEKDLMV